MGSSYGSFGGSNDGMLDSSPDENSLIQLEETEPTSSYVSFDGLDEETEIGSSDGALDGTRDSLIEGSTL